MQRKQLQNWMIQAIDTVLSPGCVISGEIVEKQGMLSPAAWANLDFITDPQCKKCGRPFEFDDGMLGFDETHCASCLEDKPEYQIARSVLAYNDASRDLVLSFKHGDQTHLVRAFIPWMTKAGAQILDKTDIVTPVPLHPWRMIKRRYNQSALISSFLAKETGIAHVPDALLRVKNTVSQGNLKQGERAKNVRKAFKVNPSQRQTLEDKNVTLIDDVYTTGATVRECTKTLLKAGVKSVSVLTITRTLSQSAAHQ